MALDDKSTLKRAWLMSRDNFKIILGMTKATDCKFCALDGHERYQPSDDQLSPQWVWSSHVMHRKILHPSEISPDGPKLVIKFYVIAGYMKC